MNRDRIVLLIIMKTSILEKKISINIQTVYWNKECHKLTSSIFNLLHVKVQITISKKQIKYLALKSENAH